MRPGSDGVRSPSPRGERDGAAAGRWPAAATSCSTAHGTRLPLRAELGERGEHGPLRAVDDVAEQGHRRDEARVADPPRAPRRRRPAASTSTTSGRELVERARAPTGPSRVRGGGCRAGAAAGTRRAGPSGELAAGVVEVAPPVAVAHHPLEVLAPGDRRRAAGRARRRRRCRRRRRSGRSVPSPKWAARARPLVTTEIASAVDSVPVGVLRLVRPSAVTPSRSSRKIVTTRRISSAAAGTVGQGQRRAQLGDALGDDRHLLLGRRRQRQHDGVEAPAQRARQLVDAAVAVVGRGDQVEALAPRRPRCRARAPAAPSRTGS